MFALTGLQWLLIIFIVALTAKLIALCIRHMKPDKQKVDDESERNN